MSPQELRIAGGVEALVATRVDPRELERAQEVFDLLAPRTFNLDLAGLSTGSLVARALYRQRRRRVSDAQVRLADLLALARTKPKTSRSSIAGAARNIAVYTSSEQLARRGRFYCDDDNAAFDVEHYALDLTFDPERSWVSGRAAVRDAHARRGWPAR